MRIQVFADIRSWPSNPFECLQIASPRIAPALALAIEPLKQDSRRMMTIGRTHLRIVRYGVIVQMPLHAVLGPP